MTDLDPALVPTRLALHALAEHVLGAARHRATGRIGLRPSPGGFTTPPFPSDHGERTVAIDVDQVVVTDDRGERRQPITTVGAAAALAEVAPGAPSEVYAPATPLAPDEPLAVDPAASARLADWFARGQAALAALRSDLAGLEPNEIQLWPEHLDLAFTAAEVNWGASPGDATSDRPYLYVGPWSPPTPDGGYWNASFGAQRTSAELPGPADDAAFFAEGRRRLGL